VDIKHALWSYVLGLLNCFGDLVRLGLLVIVYHLFTSSYNMAMQGLNLLKCQLVVLGLNNWWGSLYTLSCMCCFLGNVMVIDRYVRIDGYDRHMFSPLEKCFLRHWFYDVYTKTNVVSEAMTFL